VLHHKQTVTRLCGYAVMRSRPAWKQTTEHGDSNINGQLAAAMGITQNFAHQK